MSNPVVTFRSPATTAVEFHSPFVVVRHDFTLAKDRFYTVRDTRTGQDLSHTFRKLVNARRHAISAQAREGAALVAGTTIYCTPTTHVWRRLTSDLQVCRECMETVAASSAAEALDRAVAQAARDERLDFLEAQGR